MATWRRLAPLVLLIGGCAASPAPPPVTVTATDYVTLAAQSTSQDPSATSVAWLPPYLAGDWCTVTEETCFNMESIATRNPNVFLADARASEEVPGATDYSLCLEEDLDQGCTEAESLFLRYFPAGLTWDCVQYATSHGWPGCGEDYSAQHDAGRVRLVVLPNHQQDEKYEDSTPFYQAGR